MTANEIRKESEENVRLLKESVESSSGHLNVDEALQIMSYAALMEIAAQLAELNVRLKNGFVVDNNG